MPRAALLAPLVALAVFAPGTVRADRVVPKKGPAVRGYVTRTDTEVIVNRYRCRTPAMTFGVVRFPVADVARVEDETDPLEVVRRKQGDLKAGDVAGRVGLAKYATAQKLLPEAARLLEEALALDPTNAEALSLYGGPDRFRAARRGNPALDPDLARELAAALALPDPAARAKEARRLEAERGFPARPETYERMARSAREAKGERLDQPIVLGAARHRGAACSVFVPEDYVPWRPTPILLALHGGGAGGKAGDAVLGSGREAELLYLRGCKARGWILVCPTAVAAPWGAPANDAWLLSVLADVFARWNVDPDRVYLTGHASGGAGVWAFGSKHPELFAAIAPTASTSPQGVKALKAARTALFVYHSADDAAAPIAPVQQVVDQAFSEGLDAVYLRLEDQGHSFPAAAEAELFDVLEVRRLASAPRTGGWPRSSFAAKPTPDEIAAFGDAAASWGPSSGPAVPPPRAR